MKVIYHRAQSKLAVANEVLATFSTARILRLPGGWYIEWPSRQGTIRRRWSVNHGQSFYPPWSRKFPNGGTATTALAQLVRWLQGRPVLPLSTWRYWAGERVKLLNVGGIETLSGGGYPETARCVLCGLELNRFDWWCLDGVSGPCCLYQEGCRQEPKPASPEYERKGGVA